MSEKINIINEPIKSYRAGSEERISLQKKYENRVSNHQFSSAKQKMLKTLSFL